MKKVSFIAGVLIIISCSDTAGGNKNILGTRIDESEAGPRYEDKAMATHIVIEKEDSLTKQENSIPKNSLNKDSIK